MRELSGIRAKREYSPTPIERELTTEERRAKWQPPKRDTSRFSGTSISRQGSGSSYKGDGAYGGYQPRGDGAGMFDLLDEARKAAERRPRIKVLPTKSKPVPEFALEVIDITGRRVYQCGKSKSEPVLKRLKKRLPVGSYVMSGKTVRLTRTLAQLGFDSPKAFMQWCAGPKKGRGKAGAKKDPGSR